MAKTEKTIIQNAADPKGREVFLIQYGSKYRVEKMANGFISAFVGLKKAEIIFKSQKESSN
jgi:hypothetical protein